MRLQGKTNRGKNVIQRDGDVWQVVQASASVICFNGFPGILIAPVGNPTRSRWIKTRNDVNFKEVV